MGEIAIIDTKQIEIEVSNISQQAMAMTVTDIVSYQEAGRVLLAFDKMKKNIVAYFKDLKKAADEAHKTICDREKEELAKLSPGLNYLNKAMTVYTLAETAKRREEEERLRQIAVKAEEEERLQAAIQAEKEGDKEVAEAILSESVYVHPPIVETQAPKIDGLAMAITWRWRITNEALIPRSYLMPDEVRINGVVRSLKSDCNIPGIEVYPEQSMRKVRGANG
jgi:hypothetical protein